MNHKIRKEKKIVIGKKIETVVVFRKYLKEKKKDERENGQRINIWNEQFIKPVTSLIERKEKLQLQKKRQERRRPTRR